MFVNKTKKSISIEEIIKQHKKKKTKTRRKKSTKDKIDLEHLLANQSGIKDLFELCKTYGDNQPIDEDIFKLNFE